NGGPTVAIGEMLGRSTPPAQVSCTEQNGVDLQDPLSVVQDRSNNEDGSRHKMG
ncbi:hypothetical protein Ancab_002232, partial [Ancistrocladus abbreviatus]